MADRPSVMPRRAGELRDVTPIPKTYATKKPRRRMKPESAKKRAARLAADSVGARVEVLLRATNPIDRVAYCELNGRSVGEHMHHRRRRSQGGEDNPENFLWLSHESHDLIHAHPDWARRHGLLLGAGDSPDVLVVGCDLSCPTDHRPRALPEETNDA